MKDVKDKEGLTNFEERGIGSDLGRRGRCSRKELPRARLLY